MRDRFRGGHLAAIAAAIMAFAGAPATARQTPAPAEGRDAAAKPAPQLVARVVPANPSDPIAKVNGVVISRQRLADECVSRHGVEVLDTLIMRALIEQSMTARDIEVTAAEINAEIDRDASRAGLNRENFLRALAKEREISPRQYAEYIAYPGVALRKLAEPRVQVTDDDLEKAFEAYYGKKLVVRMILVDTLAKAKDVWNKVRENPGGFSKIAQETSMDQDSRAIGGLMAQPIIRYSEPLHVSDAAFSQLIDGDPDDTDPTHAPEDGDFTGPIQINEAAWVIFQRERIEAGQDVDRDDPARIEQLKGTIFEAKLQAEMKTVMEELFLKAAIENHLTGQIKEAGTEQVAVQDAEVQKARMSKPEQEIPATGADEKLRALQQLQGAGIEGELERPVGAPQAPSIPQTKPADALPK